MSDKDNWIFINANIITGNVAGEALPNCFISVKKGRIDGVGPMDSMPSQDCGSVVDLMGSFVMPGLINAHIHLFGTGKPMKAYAKGRSNNSALRFLNSGLPRKIFLKRMEKNARTELLSGVTTVRAMGDLHFMDVDLRNRIDEGICQGPRILAAGRGITTGGQGDKGMFLTCDSPWDMRKYVRICIRNKVDFIKIFSTSGISDGSHYGDVGIRKMTVEEMEAVCDEAHRAGLLVASHVQSTEGMREALKAGVDSIEHGSVMDDEIVSLFKENKKALRNYSVLVPTLYPAIVLAALNTEDTKISAINKKNVILLRDRMIDGLQRAVKENIRIGMGTDASVGMVTHYDAWKEMFCRVKYAGLDVRTVLHQATQGNAEILGIEKETGAIEKGKSADLVVFDGNPLDDIKTLMLPRMVVTRGRIIKKLHYRVIDKIDNLTKDVL